MQSGYVLIAMAAVDQIEFQLFHQRRHGQIQLNGPGRLEGNTEIKSNLTCIIRSSIPQSPA